MDLPFKSRRPQEYLKCQSVWQILLNTFCKYQLNFLGISFHLYIHAFALPSQTSGLCNLADPNALQCIPRAGIWIFCQPDLGEGHMLASHGSLQRSWTHCLCFPGRWRPCQTTLQLSTSSSSPHCLQCHHWGWEGKGRGQMCTNHTGYKRPLTGPGYLHGIYFHGSCFNAPWVIWFLQATETFPHNLWDKPWWLHEFNPFLSEETSLGTPHVTFYWAKSYVENYFSMDILWEKKRV